MTCVYQLHEKTWYCQDDLPGLMDRTDKWWESKESMLLACPDCDNEILKNIFIFLHSAIIPGKKYELTTFAKCFFHYFLIPEKKIQPKPEKKNYFI